MPFISAEALHSIIRGAPPHHDNTSAHNNIEEVILRSRAELVCRKQPTSNISCRFINPNNSKMCKQFLCFVCDLPLTEDGCFLKCAANPDARPPWVEPWRPTPGCPRPIYKYCNICHVQCRDTRLQNRAELQRQLGIASVIGRSDGTIDWHRSPDAVQSEAQINIPQAPVQLVSQWHQTAQLSQPGATHQAGIAPTQVSSANP